MTSGLLMLHGHLLVQEHQLHCTANLQIVVCLLLLTALVSVVVVVDAGQQLHNLVGHLAGVWVEGVLGPPEPLPLHQLR